MRELRKSKQAPGTEMLLKAQRHRNHETKRRFRKQFAAKKNAIGIREWHMVTEEEMEVTRFLAMPKPAEC